jgi:hypothetical protein
VSEGRRTAALAIVAIVLLAVTWLTTPRVTMPEVLAERGERLLPRLADATAVASLEIVDYDETTAEARPFKVENRNGRWTIPSQFDYPADAADRLARITAALGALRKDDVASDSPAEHERTGVIDPLDAAAPNVRGRGTRLTLRGAGGDVLADLIVGRPVENRAGLRYVRLPGQRRTYISNVGDLPISTTLGDWIERDLLQADAASIDAVSIRGYAVDRETGRVDPGETVLLQKDEEGWTADRMPADAAAVERVLAGLANLRIAGVVPKPPGIAATLSQEVSNAALTPDDRGDLARRGFYLADGGRLLASQGEVVARTADGVFYTLLAGEIASRDERYVFIMVNHDPASAASAERAAEGARKAAALRARFAPWYYLVSAEGLAALRPPRDDLRQP